jgi:hypothetical protein
VQSELDVLVHLDREEQASSERFRDLRPSPNEIPHSRLDSVERAEDQNRSIDPSGDPPVGFLQCSEYLIEAVLEVRHHMVVAEGDAVACVVSGSGATDENRIGNELLKPHRPLQGLRPRSEEAWSSIVIVVPISVSVDGTPPLVAMKFDGSSVWKQRSFRLLCFLDVQRSEPLVERAPRCCSMN